MTIPSSAITFAEPMDPRDIRDFVLDMTSVLADGESFTSLTVAPMAESAALGFQLGTSGQYAPVNVTNSTVRIWAMVADANQLDAGFDAGKLMGVEIEGVTNSTPPRRYQRTAAIKVIQR